MNNEKATLKLVSLAVKTPRQTKAQHIPRGSHEFAPPHPLFGYHPQARPSPTKVDRNNQTLLRQTTKYSRLFCSFGLHCFFYLQWCWSNPNTYPMASMSLLRLILFLVFIRRLALCLPTLTATIRHFWDKPQNIPRLRFCNFGLHFFLHLQWCWSNPNTYPMTSMSLLCLTHPKCFFLSLSPESKNKQIKG